MKKFLKIVLIVLSVVVIAVIGFVSFIAIRGIPSFKTAPTDMKVESTPSRLQRGKKLASMLCVKCHLDPATEKLTGKLMADAPAAFGVIHSRNITQDAEVGIGSWTDGDIAFYFVRGSGKMVITHLHIWLNFRMHRMKTFNL